MESITVHCANKTLHHKLAIQLLFHGKEECDPGHSWGPGLRECYVLHFVVSGKGVFYGPDKTYQLSRGQGFLITPHNLVHYEADLDDPWHYCWIGFEGLQAKSILQAAGVSEQQPIFQINDTTLIDHLHDQLVQASFLKSYDLMLQSIIYRLFSEIVEVNMYVDQQSTTIKTSSEEYIQKAKDWIELNYSQTMTTDLIAKHVGLNSSYLSRLFKTKYDLSLKQYMMQFRVNRAMELLQNNKLTISDVSRSVGYTDPFVFSKMFKKITGKVPSEVRSNHS